MKNIMAKIDSMRGKINPRYDIGYKAAIEVCKNSADEYKLISNGFTLGYMQGMKAARAEMKKESKTK